MFASHVDLTATTLTTPSPGPRSWRETRGEPKAPCSRGLSWPHILDFAGLSVFEPPPHSRHHAWTLEGTQCRTTTDPWAGISLRFHHGPVRHHTPHHPTIISMLCLVFSPPTSTCAPARTPPPLQSQTSSRCSKFASDFWLHRSWSPKPLDATRNDLCPVLALDAVRRDARTTTWCRQPGAPKNL